MLELMGEDISKLNDSDLQTLIGLLCEAELRAKKLPIVGITWGGRQDEADGGIDVRVDIKIELNGSGFIPKPNTGIQVKKPKMAKAAILKEMRPDGKLRKVIQELAKNNGAYIIISSGTSCTDLSLSNRIAAMQEAIADIDEKHSLTVDFYDRDRIATWVREHPSMVFWVREKIGNPILGWQPFRAWGTSSKIEDKYFIEEDVKIFQGVNNTEGLSIDKGINIIRNVLSIPGKSIRLVGLSGVGKTRLLQALFDEEVGENPLNQDEVIYGDVGDSIIPEPKYLAQQLVSLKKSLILAVDNCPPDLHRSLNAICTQQDSMIRLITVEYDIKEDQPEETEVFKLEPASEILIQKTIQYKFKFRNHHNTRKIAEFSGGNFKIAIALAKTIKRGESIEHLKDNELFERLFFQRNDKNQALLQSAEVCALVYSFNSQTVEGQNKEMQLLSSLSGKTIQEFYRDISELKRRDLIQQRGVWRAVLPHAIANRLASRALENIPYDSLLNSIHSASERIHKSFSNRLSYLHNDKNAQKVAYEWLKKNGFLGDINKLNSFGIILFKRIALLSPSATFKAIERVIEGKEMKDFLSNTNPHHKFLISLLKALAYNTDLFNKCLAYLLQLNDNYTKVEDQKYLKESIQPLFYIWYSRTKAPLNQRLIFVQKLLNDKDNKKLELGIELLKTLLKTRQFNTFHGNWDLNKRLPDAGYFPEQREKIVEWYLTVLTFCKETIESRATPSTYIQEVLINNLRDLLTFDELTKPINDLINLILFQGFWIEGWLEIRSILRYHREDMKVEEVKKLEWLEKKLAPTSLLDQARAFAFSSDRSSSGLMGPKAKESKEDWRKLELKTEELGRKIVKNQDFFQALLNECVIKRFDFNRRGTHFGRGLAKGAKKPQKIWDAFTEKLSLTDSKYHNYQVLFGFIEGLSEVNKSLTDKILNKAVSDDTLGKIFPNLEFQTKISTNTIERLKKSLEFGIAPIFRYESLGYGRYYEGLKDEELCDILHIISNKGGGIETILDILHMIFIDENSKFKDNIKLKVFGQLFLSNITFDRNRAEYKRYDLFDYKIENIVMICLAGEKGKETAMTICKKLINAALNFKISLIHFPKLISTIAFSQPIIFLDNFLKDEKTTAIIPDTDPDDTSNRKSNPLSKIKDHVLIEWADKKPIKRYKLLSSCINHLYQNEDNQLAFTPLSLSILTKAPNAIDILSAFERIFSPMSWSGSRVVLMQERLQLLSPFKKHKNVIISDWANAFEVSIQKEIISIKEREQVRNTYREERFEE